MDSRCSETENAEIASSEIERQLARKCQRHQCNRIFFDFAGMVRHDAPALIRLDFAGMARSRRGMRNPQDTGRPAQDTERPAQDTGRPAQDTGRPQLDIPFSQQFG
jgi:hypothetical protein